MRTGPVETRPTPPVPLCGERSGYSAEDEEPGRRSPLLRTRRRRGARAGRRRAGPGARSAAHVRAVLGGAGPGAELGSMPEVPAARARRGRRGGVARASSSCPSSPSWWTWSPRWRPVRRRRGGRMSSAPTARTLRRRICMACFAFRVVWSAGPVRAGSAHGAPRICGATAERRGRVRGVMRRTDDDSQQPADGCAQAARGWRPADDARHHR